MTATSTQQALSHIRAGRRACVVTHCRVTVIDLKCLMKWEAAGQTLLKDEASGFRLRTGKSSVYLFPGQLKLID